HRRVGTRIKSLSGDGKREKEIASELALHFEDGLGYESAVRYLVLAAQNGVFRLAYGETIEILQNALQLVPKISSDVRIELEIEILVFVGDAFFALGAMADAATAYQTGASRAAQAGLKAAQVGALTSIVRPFGLIDPERGIAAIAQAVQLSKSLN